jgi:DNA-binding MarR family transcriptional regulator
MMSGGSTAPRGCDSPYRRVASGRPAILQQNRSIDPIPLCAAQTCELPSSQCYTGPVSSLAAMYGAIMAKPKGDPADEDAGLAWLHERILAMVRSEGRDLSARQLGTLLICYTADAPQTVRGLALALGTHKPAVTRAVDVLTIAKLARRLPDPADRRSVLIELTPSGKAFCRRLGSRA